MDIDIEELRKLLDADEATRAQLQSGGINVVRSDYYSPIPSIAEIAHSFEYQEGAEPPYLNPTLFNAKRMNRVLQEIQPYAHEFAPPTDKEAGDGDGYYWRNGQFSHSDSITYYCFIRRYKPKTIVEIGAGYSTLVARQAVQKNGFGRIVCIDPYPPEFLSRLAGIELYKKPAQGVSREELNAWLSQDGDFFFIDSTHTVKAGCDCLHIYHRLLPALQRRIIVHSHDVFLPFGWPKELLLKYQHYWTEQYLLLSLLTDNPRARVLYGSAYHLNLNVEPLLRLMAGKYEPGGSSFWYEYSRKPLWMKIANRLRR